MKSSASWIRSGYRQIPLAKKDLEKRTFIVNTCLYCYNVMSFGLKNGGAAYQWLVNKVFTALIGKTMEVYVDDMITKSVKEIDHVSEMEETFKTLRHYRIKLNPKSALSEANQEIF